MHSESLPWLEAPWSEYYNSTHHPSLDAKLVHDHSMSHQNVEDLCVCVCVCVCGVCVWWGGGGGKM